MIAGSGVYPETFARAARAQGVRIVAAAFKGETKEAFSEEVDAMKWFRVGQLGGVIKFFKSEGASECVMIGQIAPRNLFDLWPDMRTLKVLGSVKEKNAESLFGAIATELGHEGIKVLSAVTFLDEELAQEGQIFGPKPGERDWKDVGFGFRMAKEVSRLDIGQTVVVRRGTVLAVEGFEGTDACIKRGGELGKRKDVTLVKVSKPDHDMRFDVPCIGPTTIESCVDGGIRTIAVEAGKTLILEREKVARMCGEEGVSLVGVGSADVPPLATEGE